MVTTRLFFAVVFLLFAAPCAASPDRYTEPQHCDTPSATTPVCFADRPIAAAEARKMLGSRELYAFAADGVLTVLARRHTGPVTLCCSIVAPLNPIAGSDLWSLSLRVFQLDRAIIDIQSRELPQLDVPVYRGASAELNVSTTLAGAIVRETIESAALGEHRLLSIYLPPGFDATRRYPVVYLADGYAMPVLAAAFDAQIASGRLRPLLVVGIWPGQHDPKDRAREYLPDRMPGRYRAHARFVLDEVMPLVERKFGASSRPDERMIAGFSDGAAWALSMGLAHRDLFGTVAALSFGWQMAADGIETKPRPRLFLAAGRLEPNFHMLTLAAARRAQATGGDVLFEDYTSAHSLFAWQNMFADALYWTFPATP